MTVVDEAQTRWLRGMIEACVLGVLQTAPAYGYEIAYRFEEAGFTRPKGGTLYPILSRLEDDGLVRPSWAEGDKGPHRKYYELTAEGQKAAESIAAAWPRFVTGVSRLVGQPDRRPT